MRHSGRQVLYLTTILIITVSSTQADEGVVLVQAGQCKHRIILQPQASPSERFAAEELRTHIKACTGVDLPIVTETPDEATPMIVLGRGEIAKKLGIDPSPEQLGEQGFVLRTVPPHIVIVGTKEAGTLYGVYQFLEDYLGVRWYAPGVTKIPSAKDLAVPAVNRQVKPAFLIRNTSYLWSVHDASFLARMRSNWSSQGADNPQGMGYDFAGLAHTYLWRVSPRQYFASHPEYYSELGGERVNAEPQLCLTNPDVLRIVTEKIMDEMKAQPNVHQHNFSQMDYYNYCECANCRAMNAKYGTKGGTQFWFVNELAKRTSQVFPTKQISTLAYLYTEEPPKDLKMHPNVAVWLCHMMHCHSHPIATCPQNAAYKRRAIAWSKICSHLCVWHYIVDFAHYYNPYPNFRAIAADMKFYRDIGVEGMFLQGMGSLGEGGEFSLLRPYYAMKLVWDPDRDANVLLKDSLDDYYGPAAKPIGEYITMLHDKVDKDNIHLHLYGNPAQGHLPDDVIDRAKGFFDQAEQAVQDDPEMLERVRVARMPITYARMFPRNGYKIEEGRLHWLGDITSQKEMVEFTQRMRKHGFREGSQWGLGPQEMMMLSGLLNSRLSVSTIQNDHLSVDIVPVMAGRALRIIHRKSGKCITAYNTRSTFYFPFAGGLEDREGGFLLSYGWMDLATVLSQTETAMTVGFKTASGWDLKRTITLVPDKPVLEVVTTATPRAVTGTRPANAGSRQLYLRNHLELDMGDLRQTHVRFNTRGGMKVDTDMPPLITEQFEGKSYRGQDAPNGSWSFTGPKGLEVIQTFDNKAIQSTRLFPHPECPNLVEVELWYRPQDLAPSQTAAFRQTIEVRPTDANHAAQRDTR